MEKNKIIQYKSLFDEVVHSIEDERNDKIEVWYARELQSVLGYARWESFLAAIHRAIDSCKTQNINVDDHFREVTKMVSLGSGSQKNNHFCSKQKTNQNER